jgi:hypothetical protein
MFKSKPPRGFDYLPIYYDEDKERREERAKRMSGETLRKEEMRVQLQKNWSRLRTTKQSDKRSNITLIMIIMLLALVSWWLLF